MFYFLQILDKITRLAEVIDNLQLLGNVDFIPWHYEYVCAEHSSKRLTELLSNTEGILRKWVVHVWNCRQQYHELNFFTSKQLVTLRHELLPGKEVSRMFMKVSGLLGCIVGKAFHSTTQLKKCLMSGTEVLCNKEDEESTLGASATSSDHEFQIIQEKGGDETSIANSCHKEIDVSEFEGERGAGEIPEESKLSSFQQATKSLDKPKQAVYTTLVRKYHYNKYLAYEAARLTTELTEATDWIDENEDDKDILSDLQMKFTDEVNAVPAESSSRGTSSAKTDQEATTSVNEETTEAFNIAIENAFFPEITAELGDFKGYVVTDCF